MSSYTEKQEKTNYIHSNKTKVVMEDKKMGEAFLKH